MAWTTPTLRSVGDIITAAIFNTDLVNNLQYLHDIGPAGLTYTSFTPTLTASSVNPNIGASGFANSRYIQIGKLVHYYGRVVFSGAGVAAGTGNYRISLPINSAAAIGDDTIGVCRARQSIGGNAQNSICRWNATSATFFEMWYHSAWSSGPEVVTSNANPWTWASGDEIHFAVTYEGV